MCVCVCVTCIYIYKHIRTHTYETPFSCDRFHCRWADRWKEEGIPLQRFRNLRGVFPGIELRVFSLEWWIWDCPNYGFYRQFESPDIMDYMGYWRYDWWYNPSILTLSIGVIRSIFIDSAKDIWVCPWNGTIWDPEAMLRINGMAVSQVDVLQGLVFDWCFVTVLVWSKGKSRAFFSEAVKCIVWKSLKKWNPAGCC